MTEKTTLRLGQRDYALRWDFAAIYRLQEAGREAAFDELGGKRGFKATVDLLWAMLPDEARAELAADTPAALARAVSDSGLDAEALIELLHAALTEGTSPASAKKNAPSGSPTPASSSG